MERQNVESSNIVSVGYDKESLVLEVEFKKGKVYRYSDVDGLTYAGLLTAESVGKYFHQNIKDKFSFTKVT